MCSGLTVTDCCALFFLSDFEETGRYGLIYWMFKLKQIKASSQSQPWRSFKIHKNSKVYTLKKRTTTQEQDQNMRGISSKTDRIVIVSFVQTELQIFIFSVIFFLSSRWWKHRNWGVAIGRLSHEGFIDKHKQRSIPFFSVKEYLHLFHIECNSEYVNTEITLIQSRKG